MTAEIKEIDSVAVTVGDDEGVSIRTFSLSTNGIHVHVCNVGASIARVLVPNFSTGTGVDDVVLGFKSGAEMYSSGNPTYFSAIVGRVANRIAKGEFSLNGKDYKVATNNGPNHLHGGDIGFSRHVWAAKIVEGVGVEFTLLSKDGDQAYPGTVAVKATYSLVKRGEKGAVLKLDMAGKLMDGNASPLNLANHSYFNLAGQEEAAGILDHRLTMPCEAYTPVDPTSIPTGEVLSLDYEPAMDWRSGRVLRDALIDYGVSKADLSEAQVKSHFDLSRSSPNSVAKSGPNCSNPNEPYGFDHNYVVLENGGAELNLVGTLEHKETGRRLQVMTDAPGVQLYTANWLDGKNTNSAEFEIAYAQWQGLCLETQTFPNGIIESEADSSEFAKGKCFILRPGGPDYQHRVEYHFESML
jgi:aldose 1-epimerase